MKFGFLKISILMALLVSYLNSCQTASPQAQVSDFQISESDGQQSQQQTQQAASQQGQSNSQNGGQLTNKKSTASEESNIKIYHPKEPTAWFTRRLLMTARQPSASRITECREKVESSVKDAPNLRALDEISLSLETTVSKNESQYHWCFYQIMADLDLRIEIEAPLMQDKADLFLERMKILWPLAKALDNFTEESKYLSYLRIRYTEMSQNIFGRNLETVDLGSFALPTIGIGKAAAEFEE